jgi:Pyruvate/2-oxoacid:ferredoxin oxidoreductase gamma subunit
VNMQVARQKQIIKLAILAVGGQGGGVVSDWIVHLAEENGWYAQATSVPGVAQRTGATIYYIEMVPDRGKTPVLALMPSPGDVDIVLAAELMEAGRAMMRGLVSPERTTLIASSHRAYAVSEKVVPSKRRARQRGASSLPISSGSPSGTAASSRRAFSARWQRRARCPSAARVSKRRSKAAAKASRQVSGLSARLSMRP